MNPALIFTLSLIATLDGAFIPGDTPEVSLAKVAHFAEHIKEAARSAGYQPAPTYYVSMEGPAGAYSARMPVTYMTAPESAARMPVTYVSAPAGMPVTYMTAPESAARMPVTYIPAPAGAAEMPVTYPALEGYASARMPGIYVSAPVAAAPSVPAMHALTHDVHAVTATGMHDHARAAASAAAMGHVAAVAGAGFPYVDFYKSLADYYAATSSHAVSSSA